MTKLSAFSAVLILLIASVSCDPSEDSKYDNAVGSDGTSGGPGVLDNTILIFNCYVKNANTSSPIPGAVVEWEQVGTWPGSIVYPRSGTTNSSGYFSVQFDFPAGRTSWDLKLTRAYNPNGGYKAWSAGAVIALRANSPKTVTIYLTPL